jgi:hypothetical protein
MLKKILIFLIATSAFILTGCGKKTIPNKTASVTPIKTDKTETTSKPKPKPKPETPKSDTVAVAPSTPENPAPVTKPEDKPEFPKVISVNDNAASKSVDGRLFYDVLGHRYWKNYSDGKYYLFDKSMYSNPDFKPRK